MSNGNISMEMLNPRGEIERPPVFIPSPRLTDLNGKRIGMYSNGKVGVNHLFDALEKLLNAKYEKITVTRLSGSFEIKDSETDKFVSEIDTFIYALGDCGACTFSGTAGVAKLEKRGKPGVFIIGDTFKERTETAARDNAMPTLRYRTIPLTEFYRNRTDAEKVVPIAEAIIDDLTNALTIPLTEEETAGQHNESKESTTVTVTGNSYEIAAEEFNRIFLENKWSDGLPLVPPTRERVDWMLTGTSRTPEEVIGKISPKMGMATVEKIAVNAVMAGAKPEYLPVIIALIEAISDETFDEKHVLLSPSSATLLIVVSGPIVKELKMETGIGFMGHGWRANNTIGRAVRLTTMNTGHIWPGTNDMGLTGRISPHTFFTVAENTDMSRWQAYHTRNGYENNDSCVTVASIDSESPSAHYYGGMIGTWNADDILDTIARDIADRDRRHFPEWGNKGVGPVPGSGMGSRNHYIVLFPELVAAYAKNELDQTTVREELYRRSKIPYEDLTEQDIRALGMALENGIIPDDRKDTFKEALQPGGMVPVLMSPDNIHLFVCGGAPGSAFSFSYFRVPPFNRNAVLTKKITGATLTVAGCDTTGKSEKEY